MTPAQLAAKNTESGHQKAVFAWAAMASYKGFAMANQEAAYTRNDAPTLLNAGGFGIQVRPVPELKWLHAIPNGGNRDSITASRMKAEGVRKGIADISLPVARHGFHGLYIEMKKPGPGGKLSDEQCEFRDFVTAGGYHWVMCAHWQDAVKVLQQYLS